MTSSPHSHKGNNLSAIISLLPTGSSVKFNGEMKKIIFTKMSGAGNDFVVIDKQLNTNFKASAELVQIFATGEMG